MLKATFRTLFAAALLASSQGLMAQALASSGKPAGRFTFGLRPGIAPVSPDVFGTAAVNAGVTFYDARFRRVAAADRNHPQLRQIAAMLHGLAPLEQLARVQSEVQRRVRWAHDLDTMRVADLWANAGETLERMAGDSEDIAIVKMQALKAAGWNPRDLYLSIGKHRQAGAHVLLLARTPAGFMVLDDRAATPLSPAAHGRFTPVLTLGQGRSWVHGRRLGSVAARVSAR